MNRELKIIALQEQVTELRKQLVAQKNSISEDDFKAIIIMIFNAVAENTTGDSKRNILNTIAESLDGRISFPKF